VEGDELIFVGSNRAAARILGVEATDRIGMSIVEVFPGLADTDIPSLYRTIALEGGVWESEEVAYDAEGISGAYDVVAFQIQPGQMAAAFTDVTERRAAQHVEHIYLKKLSALAAELANAEDSERRRLAEELHDRVSQPLAVAMMHVRSADSASGGDRGLTESARLLQTAITETRAITTELYPPVLYELGLAPAIHWVCEDTQRLHQVNCRATLDDAVTARLTSQDSVILFRCVRELLMNVVKHSKADSVVVSLTDTSEGACILVEDDGTGFDVKAALAIGSTGFGLFSIRERLSHRGGDMYIDSSPGHGTRVTVHLPYDTD